MLFRQMKSNKNDLRQKYKVLRRELSEENRDDKSLAIANNALKLPIWDYQYYHVYLPIVSLKEVNTETLLHLLAGKDKEIVVSKSDFNTREMQHFLLTDSTKIKVNEYGIPEPVNGLEVPDDTIEVVFVPLLAFDVNGNRVGYGKGFYDKFLAKCKSDVVKIGLSFFEADAEIGDLLPNDIPLNYCITPQKTYTFN